VARRQSACSSGGPSWVTTGKARIEHMSSASRQRADIHALTEYALKQWPRRVTRRSHSRSSGAGTSAAPSDPWRLLAIAPDHAQSLSLERDQIAYELPRFESKAPTAHQNDLPRQLVFQLTRDHPRPRSLGDAARNGRGHFADDPSSDAVRHFCRTTEPAVDSMQCAAPGGQNFNSSLFL